MSENDRNDLPPDAGAASGRKNGTPRTKDSQEKGGGEGLYVTVSRKRLDYGRPCIQPGANSNPIPKWTPARITGLGEFRALARLTTTPHAPARVEEFAKPVRPVTAGEPVASIEGGEVDDGLSGLLAAIASEVQGHAAAASAGIAADFAGRIAQAHKSLPRDQVDGAVAAFKQMKRAAVKAIRASAAIEIKGRQKAAMVLWRRRLKLVHGGAKSLDYGPSHD